MTWLRAALIVVALRGQTFTVQAPPPLPNQPVKSPATLRGHVLRADGRPLPRALVRLTMFPAELQAFGNSAGPPRSATTDEDGVYEFAQLPAGSYRVAASKTGFVTLDFGQRRPLEPGVSIALAAGEVRERIDITLPRHSAVTGRVVDEVGEPVQGANPRVFQVRFAGGRRQLAGVPGTTALPTNELGRYRIYGLQPGRYIISADTTAGLAVDEPTAYATTYFPGTPNPAEAQSVTVDISAEVANIDFALVPARTARVSGTRVTPSGEPFQGAIQMRQTRRSSPVAGDSFGARTWPDGRFEFPNLAPGEYVIDAQYNNLHALEIVSVNGADVTGLILQASTGSTISGRVTFDAAEGPNPRVLEITPMPVDPDLTPFLGGNGGAGVGPDGTFEIANIVGPRRIRLTRAPAGWGLKHVLVNGVESTDTVFPFGTKDQSLKNVEVVLTNQLTEISGGVTDARKQPVSEYAVVVFATDRDRWYEGSRFFTLARPRGDGTYAVRRLPAGDYYIAALDRVQGTNADGEWQDPEFLDALSRRATRVTLGEGQRVALPLTLTAR